MRSITNILGQFKQNWTQELSETAIDQACRKAGMTWHNSALNPIVTIQIFFFSMPDTPELQNHFGQSGKQKPGCGFPTAHWLVLLHADNQSNPWCAGPSDSCRPC